MSAWRNFGGAAVLALALTAPVWAVEVKGRIDAVTVYRGQALVTRVVDIPGPPGSAPGAAPGAAGLKEFVITDLPEQVQAGSVYAEATDGLKVQSMSYRVRPVEKDVRAEVRKLDDDIQKLQDDLTAHHRQMQLLAEQRAFLDKLQQFVAATASAEMTKGVLNADTIDKLTQAQFTQRDRLAKDELKLNVEQRKLQEQLSVLQRQRNQLAGGSSRLAREAVVFVNVPEGKGGQLKLRYLVNNAAWMPSYNVRTDGKHQGLTVEYLASVEQMSGEDWNDVAMTLSTATPALVAYEQGAKKKGVLRWDVEIPAQSFGPKSFTFDYQFRIEYDKQMVIAGPPTSAGGLPAMDARSLRELAK